MHEQNTKEPLRTGLAGLLLIPALLVTLTLTFVLAENRRATERASRHAIMEAISRFKADKKTCPRTLQELVDGGYLRRLPQNFRVPEETALEGCRQPRNAPRPRRRGVAEV